MTTLFLRNGRLLALVLAMVLVGGLSAFNALPRQEDPRIINRTAVYAIVVAGLGVVFAAGALWVPMVLPIDNSNLAVAASTFSRFTRSVCTRRSRIPSPKRSTRLRTNR